MKLFLDQCTPVRAATLLRDIGYDAVHASEVGHAASADTVLMKLAIEQGRIIVTYDSDFHAHLAIGRGRLPSVVRLRYEHLQGPAFVQVLIEGISNHEEALLIGAALTLSPGTVRIRSLPFT